MCKFLLLSEVVEIHQNQIEQYGGDLGIRDLNLLKSALGMPSITYGEAYLHANIYEKAAAYLFHITNNHPFIDGNKRTGAVSALVFLILNGYTLTASEDDFYNLVIGVAKGELDKTDSTIFFKKWAKLLTPKQS